MARFKPMRRTTAFRKLAATMWRAPNDPTILGEFDVDFTAARDFIEAYNAMYGCRITPTHLVGRAAGLLLARYPEANAKVGFSRIWLRESADVQFLVASEGGRDLWGTKIEAVDGLRLRDIETQVREASKTIREQTDPAIERGRWLLRLFPIWGTRPGLALADYLSNNLGFDLTAIGFPRDAFGGAIITAVGAYGIKSGNTVLPPVGRSAVLLSVLAITTKPWVVGDRIESRPVLRISGTFDHRVIDAYLCGKLMTELEDMLANPKQLLTEDEQQRGLEH